MIFVDEVQTYGWSAAVRGMRNPLNSWEYSDSSSLALDWPDIGPDDLKLMYDLVRSGTDHSKFMRMIIVSADIMAPLYLWKEFDTYKVGTTANSCSTMHTIHKREFTIRDFSREHLNADSLALLQTIINKLNLCREAYLSEKDKDYWWQMIQLLPSSYMQLRTVTLNYQVARNIYQARQNHKLDEWRKLCETFERLPYSGLITMSGNP